MDVLAPRSDVISSLLFDRLYEVNENLDVIPHVALALPRYSTDGRTWTVRIRDAVRFHDGSPMTAQDVAFSFELGLATTCGDERPCAAFAGHLRAVEAVDERTVAFHLRESWAPFLVRGLAAVSLVPEAGVRASLAELEARVDGAVLARLARLGERMSIRGEQAQDMCVSEPCLRELEAVLRATGVRLPERADFHGSGDPSEDRLAYRDALVALATTLRRALAADTIERIAILLPYLSISGRPIGSGPYGFQNWSEEDRLVLARNEEYWKTKVVPSRAVLLVPLRDDYSGEGVDPRGVDWVPDYYALDHGDLAPAGLRATTVPNLGWYYLTFNMREGALFAERNLRKALTHCVDHEAMVEEATLGTATPIVTYVPRDSWAYGGDEFRYVADVAAAKQLIEASGWTLADDGVYEKAGRRLEAEIRMRPGRPERITAASLIARDARRCGMDLEVPQAHVDIHFTDLAWWRGADLWVGGFAGDADPDAFEVFHTSSIPSGDEEQALWGHWNTSAWSSPEADRLLEEGRRELNRERRRAIYREFQRLVHREAPYYFLWNGTDHTALSTRLRTEEGSLQPRNEYYTWNIEDWWLESR